MLMQPVGPFVRAASRGGPSSLTGSIRPARRKARKLRRRRYFVVTRRRRTSRRTARSALAVNGTVAVS